MKKLLSLAGAALLAASILLLSAAPEAHANPRKEITLPLSEKIDRHQAVVLVKIDSYEIRKKRATEGEITCEGTIESVIKGDLKPGTEIVLTRPANKEELSRQECALPVNEGDQAYCFIDLCSPQPDGKVVARKYAFATTSESDSMEATVMQRKRLARDKLERNTEEVREQLRKDIEEFPVVVLVRIYSSRVAFANRDGYACEETLRGKISKVIKGNMKEGSRISLIQGRNGHSCDIELGELYPRYYRQYYFIQKYGRSGGTIFSRNQFKPLPVLDEYAMDQVVRERKERQAK